MAIIYSYPDNFDLLPSDMLVGSSTKMYMGRPKNETKNFTLDALSYFVNTSGYNTLNAVLNNGNTSLIGANVGELGIWDSTVSSYAKIKVLSSEFKFYSANYPLNPMVAFDFDSIVFNNMSFTSTISTGAPSANRTYTLPNASGIIALTSDIPAAITLTTTGTSGAATLVGGVLNIPVYSGGSPTIPTLDEVLNEGNTSLLDAKIGVLYLYDDVLMGYGGSQLSDNVFSTYTKDGNPIFSADPTGYYGFYNGLIEANLVFDSITAFRQYQFPDASGTIALTSDIPSLTGYVQTTRTISTTSPLQGGGDLSANRALSILQSGTSQDGYLSSTDWNTFNNKQAAGNYITALTGEASASGPGSASVTLSNSAVISKILTGLNVTGGSVVATDSILQAFGKVQNQINGLVGGSTYQGVWNASTNTPTLASGVGTQGYYYIVNVAGTTNLDGITDWNVGDWAIFDGTAWQQVDNTDAVVSVNGYTGAVNLISSDIPEGLTNLYFTDARSRSALSFTAGSGAYNSTTGVITIPTDNSQILNGAGYITSASLSPYLLISTAASTYYPIPTGTTSQYIRGDGTLATFPGLTGFVPYTGATQNLDLGTHTLLANDLVINHSSGSGVAASITKGGSGEALTVVKTSGSGNAASITGGVTLISELHLTTDLADAYIASSAVWNAKQNAITLTTTGTGAATFVGSTLNIPTPPTATFTSLTTTGSSGSSTLSAGVLNVPIYTLAGLGGQPTLSGTGVVKSTAGTISYINGTTAEYIRGDGSLATFPTITSGTVTSVSALTLGTTGTDLSSTVANPTTTPVITLNVPTASAVNRGALSSTDWTTFNNKQNAIGYTPLSSANNGLSLSGTIAQLGGTLLQATTIDGGSSSGYNLTFTNGDLIVSNGSGGGGARGNIILSNNRSIYWGSSSGNYISAHSSLGEFTYYAPPSTGSHIFYSSMNFANYGSGTKTGTATYNLSVTSTGDIIETAIPPVLPNLTSGSVVFSNGTTLAQDNANFFWDDTNNRLGIGTASPGVRFVNSGAVSSSGPTLGSGTEGSQALLSNNGLYGMYSGVSSNGDVWHQVQRNDGNSAVYNLVLQPSGGNIYLGTDTSIYATPSKFQILFNGAVEYGINFKTNAAAAIPLSFIASSGSQVGYIIYDNTGTAYTTISDYRLKEDLTTIRGLDLISKINVYDYKWKDQDKRSYGVLAHELQEIMPQAVFGEKDGIVMQTVDYSILVPILIQAIKELEAKITTNK